MRRCLTQPFLSLFQSSSIRCLPISRHGRIHSSSLLLFHQSSSPWVEVHHIMAWTSSWGLRSYRLSLHFPYPFSSPIDWPSNMLRSLHSCCLFLQPWDFVGDSVSFLIEHPRFFYRWIQLVFLPKDAQWSLRNLFQYRTSQPQLEVCWKLPRFFSQHHSQASENSQRSSPSSSEASSCRSVHFYHRTEVSWRTSKVSHGRCSDSKWGPSRSHRQNSS